jgi:hypothetical protein
MGIYKRCSHGRRERDRCSDPWYASFKLSGRPRVRVALAKWSGTEVETKGQAQAVFDDLKTAARTGTFDPRGGAVASRFRRTARLRSRIWPSSTKSATSPVSDSAPPATSNGE